METDSITFGAGCFWCLDAIARRIPGIISSVVGYAGGSGVPPTYHSLHTWGAGAGWIEGVQIAFDPEVIGLDDVILLFFQSHDPTTPNQDGANYGPEYHSTIFFKDHTQEAVAQSVIRKVQHTLARPIVTSLRPFTTFVAAEQEHQDFYNQNPYSGYCRVIIAPKLRKLNLGD
jgi:peptide-methionine (S)-S-oxide reductase